MYHIILKKKKKRTDRSNRPIAFDLKKLISDELSRQICDGKKEPALHNLAQFLIYVTNLFQSFTRAHNGFHFNSFGHIIEKDSK